MAYIGTYQEYRANGGKASEDAYLRYNKLGKYATGAAQAQKAAAPSAPKNRTYYKTGGKIPTMAEWSGHGVSYVGEYANTGKKLSDIESQAKHYNNFVKTINNMLQKGDNGGYAATMRAHGFDANGGGGGGGGHKPSGGGGGGGGSKSSGNSGGGGGYSGNAQVDALLKKMDELLGKKANKSIPNKDKPEDKPYGIEETKVTDLGEDRVRRSFLRNQRGGGQAGYSANMVVDPKTGEVFDSAKDAKDAGVTNWVYKFQYDNKMGGEQGVLNPLGAEITAAPSTAAAGATTEAYQTNNPAAQSIADLGYKWRNRNTTNKWYNYT